MLKRNCAVKHIVTKKSYTKTQSKSKEEEEKNRPNKIINIKTKKKNSKETCFCLLRIL